jgi:hypothetical protein
MIIMLMIAQICLLGGFDRSNSICSMTKYTSYFFILVPFAAMPPLSGTYCYVEILMILTQSL